MSTRILYYPRSSFAGVRAAASVPPMHPSEFPRYSIGIPSAYA